MRNDVSEPGVILPSRTCRPPYQNTSATALNAAVIATPMNALDVTIRFFARAKLLSAAASYLRRSFRSAVKERTVRMFERLSSAIAPLSPELTALQGQAKEGLAPLAEELKLYADGDYDFLLNRLWRRREAEPANRDVRQLIVDSYYNLGIVDLQRGDPAAAADKFREALELDPQDSALGRLQAFATVYSQRNEDLLFEIFVRNLPAR